MKFNVVMPVCILLFSVLVLTTDERSYRYSIATAGSSDSGFNFVTAGDWGCKNEAMNIFKMMKNMKPELYLTLGDYSYEPTLDCWYDIVKSAGTSLKVIVGNHDTEETLLETLMNKFDLAKQYYSFDYQNAHFLALSSELDSGEHKGQFEFANLDLAKANSNVNTDWIIVFFHRPFYSGSGLDNTEMRDVYHPLFQKHKVDLVLTGHAHNYQRSYPLNYNEDKPTRPLIMDNDLSQYLNQTGTVFYIIGTGGESIQGVDKKPYLASIYEGFGCLNFQINGKSLNAEFYTDQGKTIDHFTIMKNQNNPESINTISNLQQVGYDKPN